MIVTLTQICDAVRDDLDMASGVKRSMSIGDMRESIPDLPLVMVYPESGETAMNSGNDRTTFRAGVRHSQVVVHVDVYGRQRSQISEDMKSSVQMADAIIARLEAQQSKPYFGLEGLKSFKWSWERATLIYGDPQINYAGIRFILTFDVF